MRDLLIRNWGKALSEVLASVAGTLGIVYLISFIVSQQSDNLAAETSFAVYFRGGQIGLPILALSGIIFIALLRHGRLQPLWAVIIGIFYLGPILATAFIIGLNPGFQTNILAHSNLFLLWVFYCILHLVWFFILMLEPVVPSTQKAAEAEESRVNKIKSGASGRA